MADALFAPALENELDASLQKVHNGRVMRMFTPVRVSRRLGMAAAVSFLSIACLCSCEEKQGEASAPAAPAVAEEPAQDAAAAAEGTAREAVYRHLLEQIAPLVTDRAMVAEFNEPAKVYLETLQAYYAELAAQSPSVERVDIARRVAELTRNLGAYAKAQEAFERALADFEALPEAERNTVEGMRLHSSLLNGTGVCLLSVNRAVDAIPYYEKALEMDISVLRQLGVAEDTVLPEGNPDANISRAVADVLGSYRCLGESHAVAGDQEEARDIYKKGVELMTKLKNLDVNSGMGIAYVKLHGALGDLENRCGNEREALASWVQAANLCKAIFSSSRMAPVKAQAKLFFDALSPLILDKSRKLRAEAQAQQSAEAAREAAEAEKATQEAAAAQAADEARAAQEAAAAAEAEKAAAEQEAEAPQQEKRRRFRRNRH